MPSLQRYIRSIRRVGLKEWWHQLQYIGDVKSGTFVGKDQYASRSSCPFSAYDVNVEHTNRFGNRYFENLNPEEEVPGQY